jgi:hypothetical protein
LRLILLFTCVGVARNVLPFTEEIKVAAERGMVMQGHSPNTSMFLEKCEERGKIVFYHPV